MTVHSKRSERHRFLRGQRPSHRDQAILLEDDLRTAAWKVICATAHVHWPAYAPHAGSWAFDPLPFMFLNLFLCMVRRRALRVADRWDFSEVYAALADFADGYAWRPEKGRVPAAHRDRHARDADLPVSPLRDAGDSGAALAVVAVADQRAAGADPGGGQVDVIDLDLAKYERLAARFRARRARGESMLKAGIATGIAAFRRMIEQLEHMETRSRDPILLAGETGTGKSALCQRLYDLKKARQRLYYMVMQGESRSIHRAAPDGHGGFTAPTPLPEVITRGDSSNPAIDRHERFLLFLSTRPEGYGDADLYLSVRRGQGAGAIWSEPHNLGPLVNTADQEFCPAISPDGKYLFFSRSKRIPGASPPAYAWENIYYVPVRMLPALAQAVARPAP